MADRNRRQGNQAGLPQLRPPKGCKERGMKCLRKRTPTSRSTRISCVPTSSTPTALRASRAAALAIVSMLVLNSIRSIGALCKVWLPARILVGIACLLLVSRIVQKIAFWVFFPSEFIADVVLSVLFLIFYILLFNIGLRIIFALYCLITGKDEDEIMTRAIAAKTNKKK